MRVNKNNKSVKSIDNKDDMVNDMLISNIIDISGDIDGFNQNLSMSFPLNDFIRKSNKKTLKK